MKQPQSKLPKFGDWLLRFLARYDINPHLRGDFDEEFSYIHETEGFVRAWFWYWTHLLRSLPFFIKDILYWRTIMLKNYFKTALRNFQRHMGYSFINIFGFAIGIACCIFIFLWVQDELSYDRFHERADDLYRVVEHQVQTDGTVFPIARTQYPLGQSLVDDFPEIVNFTHFCPYSRSLVTYGEKNFYERGLAFADPSFLDMFSFPLVQGDLRTALSDRESILISEEMAAKYFEGTNPVGQTLTLETALDLKVTGVFKNIPPNSHLQFNFLGNFEKLLDVSGMTREWHSNNYYTYVQLAKNTDYNAVNNKIYDYLSTLNPESKLIKYLLQPVKDIHLHSYFQIDLGGVSAKTAKYVYLFSVIAVIILLIACVNFINLTTARSSGRSLEIGIRKVVGAQKTNLIRQFLGESLLISGIAFLLAIGLVMLLLPAFNSLSGKALSIATLNIPAILAGFLALVFVTGILSGFYPAFLLSSIQPVKALKGKLRLGSRKSSSRKVLVTFQFSLSIALVIGTLVVYRQLHYIQNRDLGYEKDQVIYLREGRTFWQNFPPFKEELLRYPDIISVSASSDVPTYTVHSTTGVSWDGKPPEDRILFTRFVVDYDYFETLDLEILQGRSFSEEFSTDVKEGYVLNETAARLTGYEDPIGKPFALWGAQGKIIGVVKDYHFKSLHTAIEPLLHYMWGNKSYVFIRIQSGDLASTLKTIEKVYNEHNPRYPFEFYFLDEELNRLYVSDKRTGRVFQSFMFLALFISCLGLFGLASYMADQRTKEIGIRKILGASISGIFLLLLKEFAKWVIVANAVAWPMAYLVMSRWLQSFAYRTEMAAWIFFVSGICSLVVAAATVSYQSIKASIANPVNALRYE